MAGRSREPSERARPALREAEAEHQGRPAGVPALRATCLQGQLHSPELSAELVLGFFLALAATILTQCVPELSGTSYLPVTAAAQVGRAERRSEPTPAVPLTAEQPAGRLHRGPQVHIHALELDRGDCMSA